MQRSWHLLVGWLNGLLVFLTLRKGRKFWGVVYDSVSKQPLDPVIVKLVYAHSGEPVQTCVTDLAGRYGFLARPGKFKIIAKKSNYVFPSRKTRGDTDGIFTDLYHGEFFELKDESEVLGPNIPMDPVAADWNQQAKLKVINTFPFLKLFFRRLIAVLFWFGFLLAAVYGIGDFVSEYAWTEWGASQIVLAAYVCIFFLNSVLPQNRLWGRVVSQKGRPCPFVSLELVNPVISGIVLAKARSGEDGRFLLRGNKGNCILKVTSPEGLVSEMPVTIGGSGVLNHEIKMVWIN